MWRFWSNDYYHHSPPENSAKKIVQISSMFSPNIQEQPESYSAFTSGMVSPLAHEFSVFAARLWCFLEKIFSNVGKLFYPPNKFD